MVPVDVRRALYLEPVEREGDARGLLVRPVRTSHQCRQDHLMQLAEMNSLGSLRDLLRSYKASFSSLMVLSDDELQRFFEGKLTLRSRNSKSVPSLKAWGLGLQGRICLVCMDEEMVVPQYFNYPLSLICPIHETVLLDVCDGCDSSILYTRKHRLRCGRCQRDFRESTPIPAADWAKEFRRRFSPGKELGFCSVKSHSDLAIARLLLWYQSAGGNRSRYNYPHLSVRHHPWLERVAYMADHLIEQVLEEFRNESPKRLDNLIAWTRCPTPVNSIIQGLLGNSV